MAVLLHPPPESLEIQNVLLYYDANHMGPIEAILKFTQEDCTRVSFFSKFSFSNKKLFIVLTKFVGQIRYITGRLVCGGLMWSTT